MRSLAMQLLTAAIRARWPGVVIYGIGDEPHRRRISDHNEDDTPGSNAAQSDADRVPEHRALDVMLGPRFTRADGDALVAALIRDPRIFYVIFNGRLWSRTYGWDGRPFGDPHRDHVHISGLASQDEHPGRWPRVQGGEQDDMDLTDKIEHKNPHTGGKMVSTVGGILGALATRTDYVGNLWTPRVDEKLDVLLKLAAGDQVPYVLEEIRSHGERTRAALRAQLEAMAPDLAGAVAEQLGGEVTAGEIGEALAREIARMLGEATETAGSSVRKVADDA